MAEVADRDNDCGCIHPVGSDRSVPVKRQPTRPARRCKDVSSGRSKIELGLQKPIPTPFSSPDPNPHRQSVVPVGSKTDNTTVFLIETERITTFFLSGLHYRVTPSGVG